MVQPEAWRRACSAVGAAVGSEPDSAVNSEVNLESKLAIVSAAGSEAGSAAGSVFDGGEDDGDGAGASAAAALERLLVPDSCPVRCRTRLRRLGCLTNSVQSGHIRVASESRQLPIFAPSLWKLFALWTTWRARLNSFSQSSFHGTPRNPESLKNLLAFLLSSCRTLRSVSSALLMRAALDGMSSIKSCTSRQMWVGVNCKLSLFEAPSRRLGSFELVKKPSIRENHGTSRGRLHSKPTDHSQPHTRWALFSLNYPLLGSCQHHFREGSVRTDGSGAKGHSVGLHL